MGARLARYNICRHANHGYNSQMILKWHRYHIFYNNLLDKKFLSEFGDIRGINYSCYQQGQGKGNVSYRPFQETPQTVHDGRFQNFEVLLFKIL